MLIELEVHKAVMTEAKIFLISKITSKYHFFVYNNNFILFLQYINLIFLNIFPDGIVFGLTE